MYHAIARKKNISRTTVYKFLDMSFEECQDWVNSLKRRTKKLDPYEKDILGWLREHLDLSSSQVSDWLSERYPKFTVGDSTVRAFVSELREQYHIPKVMTSRTYESIEELPPGKQIQVVFGEITLKQQKENL